MLLYDKGALLSFFFRSFALGALYAAIYLLCGFGRLILRKTIKNRIAQIALLTVFDLLLCLAASFFDMLMIFAVNRGQVRISALVCQALGFLLVYKLCKKPSDRLHERLLGFLYRLFVLPLIRQARRIKEKIKEKRAQKKRVRYDQNLKDLIARQALEDIEALAGQIFAAKG